MKGANEMVMNWAKTYTDEERKELDEFYTPIDTVKEHIQLAEKYLGLNSQLKVMTCFGTDNPYTLYLLDNGYDVKDYETFEQLLDDASNRDRILIDNPPFSSASKDRKKLEKLGVKYCLLASGSWLPIGHKYGMILFKQPRKYFTNRKEQVLVTIMHNFSDIIYSEYVKKQDNKFSNAFIAVNLGVGQYKRAEIKVVKR